MRRGPEPIPTLQAAHTLSVYSSSQCTNDTKDDYTQSRHRISTTSTPGKAVHKDHCWGGGGPVPFVGARDMVVFIVSTAEFSSAFRASLLSSVSRRIVSTVVSWPESGLSVCPISYECRSLALSTCFWAALRASAIVDILFGGVVIWERGGWGVVICWVDGEALRASCRCIYILRVTKAMTHFSQFKVAGEAGVECGCHFIFHFA